MAFLVRFEFGVVAASIYNDFHFDIKLTILSSFFFLAPGKERNDES